MFLVQGHWKKKVRPGHYGLHGRAASSFQRLPVAGVPDGVGMERQHYREEPYQEIVTNVDRLISDTLGSKPIQR
jgi:hypothetical protein